MRSLFSRIGFVLMVAGLAAEGVSAQGVTTGAITGTITNQQGAPVPGAQVQIINRSTGYSSGGLTRANGLYFVQGLEVGGPYTVRVTVIGYEPVERNDVYVTLSSSTRIDFSLAERAVALAPLEITTSRTADFSPTRQGVSNTVTDTLIRRLPSQSRDILDMLKLTPQVVRPADPNGGPSAGGQYNRFNNFTIDGASAADRFNLNASGGAPGSAASARLISVEAVKEFRVAMTPSDVRQGNFTGMLVNAVTKSGTNNWTGGGTVVFRNETFAGKVPFVRTVSGVADTSFIRQSEQEVKQFGFSLGGPLIRDRLHFFIAPEFQERARPAAGPSSGGGEELNVSLDSINAIKALLPGLDAGNADPVSLSNPVTNLFGRLDFAVSNQHRLVFRVLHNRADDQDFFRNLTPYNANVSTQNSGIRLTSNQTTRVHRNTSVVGQVYSNLTNGWSNELIVGFNRFSDIREIPVKSPEIAVAVTPIGGTSPTAVVTLGTEEFSPRNALRETVMEVVNNLTIPLDKHTITLGARAEVDKMFNFFAQRLYGVYTFPNINALRTSAPSGYTVAFANSGVEDDIGVDMEAGIFSGYLQDQWAASDRLTFTLGLRVDVPMFLNEPTDNPRVTFSFANFADSIGEIRTSTMPKSQPLFSPRFGFNYDPTGDRKNQIRGSLGIFTSPPPFIMLGNAYANNALGLVTLACTTAASAPTFTTSIDNLPKACRTGTPPVPGTPPAPGAAGTLGININDKDFKYPQYYVASFGFDRQLPLATVLTFEAVYRKAKNGVLIRDVNLGGPRIVNGQYYTDRNGRVLYADTIVAAGTVPSSFRNQRYITFYQGVGFSEGLIQVTNQDKDYNYTLSGQLRKRFSNAFEATAAYTYMQSKDVQSLTSDRAVSNFRNGRQLSGAHHELETASSVFERPHRVVAYGTYTLPWKTDISLYYEAVSGAPLTYVTNGDTNGDGVTTNDPIYIPTSATDANEIRWQNGTDGALFEKFISDNECLAEQRGKIMERDSCYAPMQHRLDFSVRQTLPELRGQRLALQLDIFNLLNLLNRDWGQIELPTLSPNFPQQSALRVVGRTPGPLSQSYPILTFDSNLANRGAYVKQFGGSNAYQMQLTLRYAF
jgi:hypothetical protein